jgi:hypothetical protein
VGFYSDRHVGKMGESLVISLLKAANLQPVENKSGELAAKSSHDIAIRLQGRPVTLEVKFDRMAAKTGNIAIEYWKPNTKTASGLGSTGADLWVHILSHPLAVYVTSVRRLTQYVATTKPVKTIAKAGDGNASIHLYPCESILPAVFYGLDVTVSSEMGALLWHLVSDPSTDDFSR